MAQVMQHAESASSSDAEGGCFGGKESDNEQYQKGPISSMPAYIRAGFIRKVYSILAVQLLITVAIGATIWHLATPAWISSHMNLFYFASFSSLAIIFGMYCCCQTAAKTYPTNYILLFSFTIFEAVTIGFVCAFKTGPSVLMAVAATALIFLSLTAYACYTKTDFTGMGPYLFAALSAMLCFSFIVSICSWFMPIPHGVKMVYSFVGVILFSFYIVYDTQLIVGGKHTSIQFEVDDYCYAALQLYLDIINIFLYLLELFGDRR